VEGGGPGAERALRKALLFVTLTWVTFSIGQAVNRVVLGELPLRLGESPGLTPSFMFRWVAPFSLAVSVVLWALRRRVIRGRIVATAVSGLLILSVVQDLYIEGRFLVSPSYRSQEIGNELRRRTPDDSSIIGDYAPFFGIRANRKSLYMNRVHNPVARLGDLKPDFLLYSNTTEMKGVLEAIQTLNGVALGPILHTSTYAERKVVVYPLVYER
jgi:hypothetical protein